MNAENPFVVQNQIRENTEEVQNYLKDLDNWEKEMKKKEQELKLIQVSEQDDVPPIRNTLSRSKKRNKHRKNKEKDEKVTSVDNRISGYDYKSWEKYDADSELKKLDAEKKESSASDSGDNEEEELVRQQNKQRAIIKKDKGNDFFKKGNYDSAINCYTLAMELDPENPLLPANRAMAFLKKEQFQAAENDSTLCLSLDPTYVKAYFRRGTARKALTKISLAKEDYLKVLELEPENKQAQVELEKIKENYEQLEINHQGENIFESSTEKDDTSYSQFIEENLNDTPLSEKDLIVPSKSISGCYNKVIEKTENACDGIKNIIAKLEQSVPGVPTTSFQFLIDWKKLSKYPELKYQYLKQFPPEKFPVVFKYSMEAEILPEILKALSTLFIENGDDVFYYMKYLASVGRFNTALLFLSNNEKEDINKLASYLRISPHDSSEVENLLKLYKFG